MPNVFSDRELREAIVWDGTAETLTTIAESLPDPWEVTPPCQFTGRVTFWNNTDTATSIRVTVGCAVLMTPGSAVPFVVVPGTTENTQ